MRNDIKKEIEELGLTQEEYYKYKLEVEVNLKKILKYYGRKMMIICSLFIPLLLFCIIIGIHSNVLITKSIFKIVSILLIIISIIFILGLLIYIKNYSVNILPLISIKLRNVYLYFITCYITILTVLLFIFYGPIKEFKIWSIKTMSLSENIKYPRWIYSEKEINKVLENLNKK